MTHSLTHVLDRSRSRRTGAGILLLISVFSVAAACATTDESLDRPTFSVPGNTLGTAVKGDTCNDPAGDLADSVRGTGTLTEPAGIDLVRTSAKVDGETLEVSFTTVGAIESAANPVFFVQQGDTSQAINQSFELRAQPDQSGTWSVRLITFANNRERPSAPLATNVAVDGNRLTYSVPVKSLPTIATILWQFGATGGVSNNNRVIDDCLPFNQTAQPGTSAAGAPTSSSTTPPRAGTVGQQVTATDGTKVIVKTVDNPAKPTRQLRAQPIPQNQLAAIEAEVCAGPAGVDRVGDFRFTVQTTDGRSFDPWAADDFTNEPRFKLETSLRAGECEKGWINYEIPKDAQIAQVTYDVAGKKVGPYVVIKNG